MAFRSFLITCVLLLSLFLSNGFTALPPQSEEVLREMSDLILTGTVKDIHTKDKKEGKFVKTYYYVDIAIKKIEKGTIDNKNNHIQAVGWEIEESPPGWAGPSGIYGLGNLKKKAEVRLFLSGNNIVEPNGLQVLDPKPRR